MRWSLEEGGSFIGGTRLGRDVLCSLLQERAVREVSGSDSWFPVLHELSAV